VRLPGTYYSRGMDSARPRIVRRRPRRGSVERPINVRLVRGASLVLVLPVLILGFTIARPGPVPTARVAPTFDAATATRLTRDLARDYPTRVPGSRVAIRASVWYRDQIALYGLPIRVQRFDEDIPGIGRTTLQNLITVVEGQSTEAIAFVAHRDNVLGTSGANDNASGTAALIELARAYAPGAGGAEGVRPLHTLVFVSADAGAYGGAGVRRFLRLAPEARTIVAAVVLDGLAGAAAPRIEVGGPGGRSPTPALVRTVGARLDAATARAIRGPGLLEQLTGLGLRFGYGEQSDFLARGIPAVRIGNAGDGMPAPSTDELGSVRPATVAFMGSAAEATLASLDQSVGLQRSTRGFLFIGTSAVRGWSLQLLLLALLIPFTAGVADLAVRLRRRGTAIRPALNALRRRFGFWLYAAAAVFFSSLAGVFSSGDGPVSTSDPSIRSWPAGGLVVLGVALLLGWLVARMRLLPGHRGEPEADLAGQVAALLAVAASAVVVALANPYAILFVVPSLAAWLWLPQLLSGEHDQLDLGGRSLLYAVSLATTGTVPWLQTLGFLLWLAAAAQLGAIEAGRYGPARPNR
jgi:Peptidase family M28